jgi:secreted PhoX family phosphatase
MTLTKKDVDSNVASHDDSVEFDALADKAISRRKFLMTGAAFGASAFVSGCGITTSAGTAGSKKAMASALAFTPVAASVEDNITVPAGFKWHVVAKWGDPLWSKGVDFDHATRGTGASQEMAFGDNCDGMSLFTHRGKNILVVNNEYVNRSIIYGNRETKLPENADDVRKGKAGHGVTVMEITYKNGEWSIVKDSAYNRRITADTPMAITGPAKGADLLKTKADPNGEVALGTWNNCGNGETPWGTYLACEENFNGYFSSSDENVERTASQKRYGIKTKDWGYNWAMTDERFDISKHPNEANRFGYIVEIDPLDPTSMPKKRTALGRFKHENAEVVVADNGHVVVYMGDDERGEFLYKFVSEYKFEKGGKNADLLENGTIYVAKFSDEGKGQWVPLTPATTGMSNDEIIVNTRMAGSKVGATTMDRPEWVAANPMKAEVCCALTNNKNRNLKPNAGGDLTPVNGPNPREKNNYGQIVRWMEAGGDHTATEFEWDLFVTVGNPTVHNDAYAGSENITEANIFNSPDGIKFDTKGRLWIQTDGNYSNKDDYANMGNNQMLLGDTATGEIRRFMTGPNECEITGLTWSADKKTMFVGIQHPGEKGNSNWPEGGDSVPRSAVVAVSREDGGEIV